MKPENVLLYLALFLFFVFLFPTLNSTILDMNSTSSLAPAFQAFPYVLLACMLLIPIYMIIRRKKD